MNRMVTDEHIAEVARNSFNLLDHGSAGNSAPVDADGKDGDLYIHIDTNINHLYIKMNGHWVKLGA